MIAVNEPSLGEDELRYVTDCVASGWISSAGRYIQEFETGWAEYCGRRYGVAVSNGTTALQLAVGALGLEPGDEVIIPTFTIISCALAVIYNGATPVLVDADPDTWCIDVDQVAHKITPRTKAVMPVHIYGHPADMDPLLELADRHDLAVIEDAAEAHGAQYLSNRHDHPQWRKCGGFGDLSCFSFYANKLVTTGEGGMVVTDDSALAETLRSLRNLGFVRERRFYHEVLGFNFRLTNLQAALGVAQLQRMDAIVRRKRDMAALYNQRLGGVSFLELPPEREWAQSVYWMYGVVLREQAGLDAATLAARLQDRGVETRPFFLGMHRQPALREKLARNGDSFPVADRLARTGLYLPSGLALRDEQIDDVCAAVHEALA